MHRSQKVTLDRVTALGRISSLNELRSRSPEGAEQLIDSLLQTLGHRNKPVGVEWIAVGALGRPERSFEETARFGKSSSGEAKSRPPVPK